MAGSAPNILTTTRPLPKINLVRRHEKINSLIINNGTAVDISIAL
ncbi:MAG: hypothetical protein ACR2NY_06485 [Alphaproteobacteria bacterium]